MKRKSIIEYIINKNISDIWKVVTNNKEYNWRSDIKEIKILLDNEFIEYYKEGGETKFHTTDKIENKKYAFNMENNFFRGKWTGEFVEISQNETKLVFQKY